MLDTSPFIEKLIELKRVSKVVKGGKRLKLYACVVVGDGTGNVGIGHAKSSEVAPAIRKATESAKKKMTSVDVTEGTILYATTGKFCASKVILKPALTGTGIIASSAVRAVCEAAGIKNILAKSLGSNNPHNLIKATFDGLLQLKSPDQIAQKRGKKVAEIL